MRTNRTQEPPAPTATRRPRTPTGALGAMLTLGALALVAVPGLAGAAAPGAAPASASTGVWAWGAFANTTYVSENLGAYANSLNLTNGNLSATNAYVAAIEELHAEQGAFAVVNATAPSPSTRYVTAAAVALVNDSGLVAVTGDLPVAGTYANGSAVPLANTTCYYAVRLLEESAYVLNANYSYANGSLSLVDEQLNVETAINTTVIAYHWPTYAANSNGTTTLRYTTSVYVVLGWVGETVRAHFAPALPLVEAPLALGKSWNATSNVSVTGTSAYAVVQAARSGSVNTTSAASGSTSLNASATVRFQFDVVGASTVILPNGSQETGFTIAATPSGGTTSSYTLWDGLAVLPTAGGAPPVARPTTRMTPAIAAATASGPAEAIVTAGGMPVATVGGTGSNALDTAPTAPVASQSRIVAVGTLKPASEALVPAITAPPSGPATARTPPANTPPAATPPASTPAPPAVTPPAPPAAPKSMNPLSVGLLVGLVAAIGVGFLLFGISRARRAP